MSLSTTTKEEIRKILASCGANLDDWMINNMIKDINAIPDKDRNRHTIMAALVEYEEIAGDHAMYAAMMIESIH